MKRFEITPEQMALIGEYIDEGEMALGASMMKNTPFYVLKAINDEIKAAGMDWQYDLNEKGVILQNLYEAIYAQNTHLLDDHGNFSKN